VVVISGDKRHARSPFGELENAPDDAVVGLGPVPAVLEAPHVDDVAHEIQVVALDVLEEVRGVIRPRAGSSEVEIAYEDGAES
jgi:hypothetical protein